VQFAGIGWFSNFEIDPGFIPFPLPAMRAVTATASAIDIRVNHQPGYQARIDPGHFAIEDIPAPAGAGHLELITRDMFGNETRMIQPIYIAPRLLKRGLSAFAITLGAERAHYGERNFSYHAPFASAGLRHGLTEWLTLNTAAEVSQAVIDPVVGADLVLGTFASASLGLGGSWTDLQESTRATRTGLRSSTTTTAGSATGLAWFASVNRSTDRFSFGGGIRHASPHYRQIGAAGAHSLDTSYEVQVGASLLGGTLTASTAWMAYRNARDLRLATLSYTRRVLGRGQLSVGGSYIGGERARGELRAVVVMPLGERRNTSAGLALREDGQHATTFSMARSLPAGPGIGYDFSVATGDLLDARAGLRLRNQVLEADVDLVQRGAQTGAVARLRGGAVAIADHVFAARRVRDGLVLVETAGAEGVPVRLNNQDFGHSDRHGRALVPVQPFIPARITLDDSALPLSLRLDRSTTEITVERGRVGVTRFRAITSYSMTAILRLPDGQTPEPGALLKADGSPEPLPVGYDGVVFLSSEIPVRSYALTTVEGDCAFEVRFDETKAVDDETLPVLLCH
jgi:outer membrane usher protein